MPAASAPALTLEPLYVAIERTAAGFHDDADRSAE